MTYPFYFTLKIRGKTKTVFLLQKSHFPMILYMKFWIVMSSIFLLFQETILTFIMPRFFECSLAESNSCNILEAINLCLMQFKKHTIGRSLFHTGKCLMILSPGKCTEASFFEIMHKVNITQPESFSR